VQRANLTLDTHATITPPKGPVVLCILDGVGLAAPHQDNAVFTAATPNLDRYLARFPTVRLKAHGVAVGLPSDADMGNSEVGHNAMGAGRVFDQGAKLVDQALRSGRAFEGLWKDLVARPTLHLIGLLSDGNVHSHIDHLFLILDQAQQDGARRLRVHVLTDGRDVDGRSALTYLGRLEERLAHLRDQGVDAQIASGGGRMHITMDRYEADWDMVARGYRAHVCGEGRVFTTAGAAVETFYAEDLGCDDQYLPAFVIHDGDGPVGRIEDGHAVLFFNFRGDRAIQISRAFTEADFDGFSRGPRPDVLYAGMMQYDGDTQTPPQFLVDPPNIDRPLAAYLSAAGLRSFVVAETQKFGHVTYFFNGNRSSAPDPALECWHEVPSDVGSPEHRPWMKAAEVTDAAVDAILSGRYEHIRMNYANGDMVGHTGSLEATRIAVSAVDLQLARLERAIAKVEGILLITADHGNADEMWSRKGGDIRRDGQGEPQPRTSHTLNPVPFILVDPTGQRTMRDDASGRGLASIAATVLGLCGLQPPADYAPGLCD
jgi:2,3-bisphosphoglycerate-independent phosphoglycerate mutase